LDIRIFEIPKTRGVSEWKHQAVTGPTLEIRKGKGKGKKKKELKDDLAKNEDSNQGFLELPKIFRMELFGPFYGHIW